MGAGRREPKRIEVSDQMAIHAIGADQHDGADRLAGGPEGLLAADFEASLLRFGAYFVADLLLFAAPIGSEGVEQLALFVRPAVFRLPGRAAGLGEDRSLRSFKSVKKARQSAVTEPGFS